MYVCIYTHIYRHLVYFFQALFKRKCNKITTTKRGAESNYGKHFLFQRISIYVDGIYMSVEKIKNRTEKKKSKCVSAAVAVAVRKRQPGPLGVRKNQVQNKGWKSA